MKKRYWLLIILIGFALIGYFSLLIYDSISYKKYLKETEQVLDESNIFIIEILKCAQDRCIENNGSLNQECYQDCKSLFLYADISQVTNYSDRQFEKFYLKKQEDLRSKYDLYWGLLRVETGNDINNLLSEFDEYYEVDSITYDPKDIVIVDLEISNLTCSENEVLINVKLVNSNFQVKELRFTGDGKRLGDSFDIPQVGSEKTYYFSLDSLDGKIPEEVAVFSKVAVNGNEYYFESEIVNCV